MGPDPRKAHAQGYTCGIADALVLAFGAGDPIAAEECRWKEFAGASDAEQSRNLNLYREENRHLTDHKSPVTPVLPVSQAPEGGAE